LYIFIYSTGMTNDYNSRCRVSQGMEEGTEHGCSLI